MRRWLSLLLLVLIPLLSSWSAATAYCEHASETQVRHFGHHPHQHADEAGSTVADTSDCDHCHTPSGTLPFSATVLSRAEAGQPGVHADGLLRLRSLAPPERPKWAGLA